MALTKEVSVTARPLMMAELLEMIAQRVPEAAESMIAPAVFVVATPTLVSALCTLGLTMLVTVKVVRAAAVRV